MQIPTMPFLPPKASEPYRLFRADLQVIPMAFSAREPHSITPSRVRDYVKRSRKLSVNPIWGIARNQRDNSGAKFIGNFVRKFCHGDLSCPRVSARTNDEDRRSLIKCDMICCPCIKNGRSLLFWPYFSRFDLSPEEIKIRLHKMGTLKNIWTGFKVNYV